MKRHFITFCRSPRNSFSQSSDENEHLMRMTTVARATRSHCNQRNMIGVEIPFYCLADTHTRHPNILDDIPFSVAVYHERRAHRSQNRQAAVSLSIGIQTSSRNVDSTIQIVWCGACTAAAPTDTTILVYLMKATRNNGKPFNLHIYCLVLCFVYD